MTTMTDDFIDALQLSGRRVIRTHRGWTAQCPAHEDGEPSLGVLEGRTGRPILTCFAGCDPERVAVAINWPVEQIVRRGARRISPSPVAARRRVPVTPPRPLIERVLLAFNTSGIGYRCTGGHARVPLASTGGLITTHHPASQIWVADHCPHCDAPRLWIYLRDDAVTFACSDGCGTQDIVKSLNLLADLVARGVLADERH